MTNKNTRLIFGLLLLACVSFITCNWDNPILEKWWVEPAPAGQDYIYVPLTRYIPEVRYETIIQHETVYETIIQEVYISDPDVIYETIYIELPPEVIYEVVYQIVEEIEYVDVIHEIETIVEVLVPADPDINDIIHWLEGADKDQIIEIIKVIKENIDKEIIIEIIEEVLKDIPPEELIKYLTEEQIRYIIQTQPAQSILQSIQIIDIEYIIFAGGARIYNGDPVPITGTALTAATKSTNTSIINASVAILDSNVNNLVLLHGHANPVDNTQAEIEELKELSLARANAVADEFSKRAEIAQIDLTGRMQTKGFGGEGNIAVSSTSNADLNRRVEVILFRIDTTTIGP